MCGWAGFLYSHQTERFVHTAHIKHMVGTLAHRGPDDEGVWMDGNAGVALGFRRLAIVDLSAEGHQPMHSRSKRYVIAFNGEVYNFEELRQQLIALGHSFHGHSDTEVMLAAIDQWGVAAAVERFNGMFAFALWDKAEHTLTLVRDRLGIKPLYYGLMNGTFLFGSELKALRAHPAFDAQIDRGALTAYLRQGYVPSPLSIYQGVQQLRPGCMVTVRANDLVQPQQQVYWSASAVAERGVANQLLCSDQEAVAQLDELLRDAVRMQMMADVPLGAFLSGGVDSSVVVALMQAQSMQPVRTFSIGFEDTTYNEAPYARDVAAHLGTNHTELYVTAAHAQAVIPQLAMMYDEPFADASQIPTFLLAKLTRHNVTVSLSGDGGDELFAGYSRYFAADAAWNKLQRVPLGLRRGVQAGITALRSVDLMHITQRPSIDRLLQIGMLGSADDIYRHVSSQWKAPETIVINGYDPIGNGTRATQLPEFMQRMMVQDTLSYLPDDILTKVDRASMAASLEARVPLLDHRVVEFAWRLPHSLKVRDAQSKWLLRQMLYTYVPRSLIERPKMGFGIPLGSWLRGSLRDWAEDLLNPTRLRREGFFHPQLIRTRWNAHLKGQRDHGYYLWNVLMFQAWLEQWGTQHTHYSDSLVERFSVSMSEGAV